MEREELKFKVGAAGCCWVLCRCLGGWLRLLLGGSVSVGGSLELCEWKRGRRGLQGRVGPTAALHTTPALWLLQVIDADRSAAAAVKLAEEADAAQRSAAADAQQQAALAAGVQAELDRTVMERTHAQHQLAVAEKQVGAGDRGTTLLSAAARGHVARWARWPAWLPLPAWHAPSCA